jgi:hypothetical protein
VLLLYVTVKSLVSSSQVADLAPASFAAFSIFDLHIPQLPDTLKVSVFVWAEAIVAKANDNAATENNLNAFIN